MTSTEATAEVFLMAFKVLPKQEKETVLKKLLLDKKLYEDMIDLAIIRQRQNEPSRSLQDYLHNQKA